MRLVIELNREELSNLHLGVLVERFESFCSRWAYGSKRRKYREQFTERERRYIGKIYTLAYRWTMVTGYPERFLFRKVESIDLIKRAVAFAATM